ncbi:MAG: twin-arginine translocase subunit TatC [Prevotellaceae bacterium]|jgi:sec-independent protein translocase protein TatC|nr:twin-arginine translocase subunit TatC [Prevotellaceae bacterium]
MTQEMSFWGHLEALRRMLFRIAMVLVFLMVVVFLNKSLVFDSLVFAPRTSDFILYKWLCALGQWLNMPAICEQDFALNIININVSGQFLTHLSMSFWIGFVLAFPYIIWEIWRFIAPALYEKEQRAVKRAFFFSSFLFFIGVVVGYLLLFPIVVRFFGEYQVSEIVPNTIDLGSYTNMFVVLILTMGIFFELPMLIYILSHIGIVNRRFLRKYRRHAIVLMFILSALVTPTDLLSLFIVAIPLCLLYELSIFICKKESSPQITRINTND